MAQALSLSNSRGRLEGMPEQTEAGLVAFEPVAGSNSMLVLSKQKFGEMSMSATAETEACLAAIERHNGTINAMATVCTGLHFRGHARGGDVLATIDGLSRRPEVDAGRLCLAGWSHGGWGILEAMSADPRPGALGLSDPAACDLAGVKGAWLAYPYVGFLAANRMKPWRHCPKTLGVIARTDHLTTVRNAERVHAMVRNCGVEVETWIAEGTHAFDEPMSAPPMRHDPELAKEAIRRFTALMTDLAPAL